ncbi:MAG: hypothetical protein Rhirs2KO_09810 [Rhizobiaceae bacterium]
MRTVKLSIAAIAAVLHLTTTAETAESGWGLQFNYDPFAERLFPVAVMKEKTEGYAIDPASMFLVCVGGEVRATFQDERFSFDSESKADFRGPAGVASISFRIEEVAGLGSFRIATASDSNTLISIFTESGAPVPFQSRQKQGVFPVIGFAETLTIMREFCVS